MENQNEAKTALNILSLEDSQQDFEIIRELLIDEGFDLKMNRVENEKNFVLELRKSMYDIILADFNLPSYNAFEALKKSNEICPDIPFIIVSGTIGEVTAIELIKQGATDYVLKDKPGRLLFAIRRALEEIRKKEKAIEKLQQSEERYRLIFEGSNDAIFISSLTGVTIEGNRALEELLGLSREDIIGKNFLKLGLLNKSQIPQAFKLLTKGVFSNSNKTGEFKIKRKDGKEIYLELKARMINFLGKRHMIGLVSDITERKMAEITLQRNEENFHRSVEESPLGIRIVTENGNTLFANKTILYIYGF